MFIIYFYRDKFLNWSHDILFAIFIDSVAKKYIICIEHMNKYYGLLHNFTSYVYYLFLPR